MVAQFFNLEGKNAIVAGMGNSIAKEVSLTLAEAGANIAAVCTIPNEKESKMASEIDKLVRDQGRAVIPIMEPPTSEEKISAVVARILERFESIDIFVNNLDLPFAKPIIDSTFQEWLQVIEVNLNQFFLWSKILGKVMTKQKKGRIISLTSHLAQRGMDNCSAYCAAKGGIIQMTRALALEWAKSGVTVNAVSLGWIEGAHLTPGIDESALPALIRYLPIRRTGTSNEVGGLVLYLASDEAEFISGQVFSIDGGVACHP